MKKIILLLALFIYTTSYSQNAKEISREWTSFTQSLSIESKTKKKFKIEASVKVISDEKQAWAGLWARVDNKNKETGFFDNMRDRPIKSNDWQTYTIEGTIDENSKTLNLGGLCLYNGKFFFDDFELFIENDKGVLEVVKVFNGDFEKKVENGTIPRWSQGVSKEKNVKVKEFDVTSTTDKVEGKLALLIEGKGIVYKEAYKINPMEDVSPQIGTLIAMLENLKDRVENQVKNMTQYELDYLHDEKANRIGSLIMHLAAAEKYYQVYTFENREFNEEEKKIWQVPLDLDQGGRDELRGHDAQYYLDIFNEVRAKTIAELKKRDDVWLTEVHEDSNMNNFFGWFHVMEHQSSHLGQILFLKKRIPPEPEVKLEQSIKN
ncbi:DinB family protein [Flavobacterium sp. HNIBRBA15423]|uniref:DinB family protein n=1 Tax=Flavobacterium sp. HNIBRBA15423 TaxID=3458683 RepID=UPI00404433A9